MTAAHLHLVLNHIPVLGAIFGVLLLAYGHWRASTSVTKAALGLLVGAGAVAVAVYLTGEPAEEIVEGMAGMSHDALETHEAWGWYAALASVGTGLAALGALLYGWGRQSLAPWTVRIVLVLALLTSGLMVYTANLGGKVSHPELRATTTDAHPVSVEQADPEEEADEREHEEEE
jgi:hypothetical protein